MPALDLLDRKIEYQSAVQHESNILKKLTYRAETRKVYLYLLDHIDDIRFLAAHHLGVNQKRLIVSGTREWIRGGFNVCIPVEVEGHPRYRRLLMRCPMAHKLASADGSVDEKLRCEVAAYAYIQDHCPDIRVPDLLGFGMTNGRKFTHQSSRPLHVRLLRVLQRCFCALLGYPVPSRYVPHDISSLSLDTGYLLLQRIEPEDGEMLSRSWKVHMGDSTYRANLFRGIARVTLSLARVPQARIGSFTFRDDGTIALSNRPLTSTMALLEHFGVSDVTTPTTTYSSIEPYVSDLLTYQDQRFLTQPNAVFNREDAESQMSKHTLLRAIGHLFIRTELRNGPFVLRLTDLHQSNIFVDKSWNITYLIDLEWVCSQPVDMLRAPYWLTGLGVDEIDGDNLKAYNLIREEFMTIFEEEERNMQGQHGISLTQVHQSGWKEGRFWYFLCISSISGMYTMFPHFLDMFKSKDLSAEVQAAVSTFWRTDASGMLEKKLQDKVDYDESLRLLFDEDKEEVTG